MFGSGGVGCKRDITCCKICILFWLFCPGCWLRCIDWSSSVCWSSCYVCQLSSFCWLSSIFCWSSCSDCDFCLNIWNICLVSTFSLSSLPSEFSAVWKLNSIIKNIIKRSFLIQFIINRDNSSIKNCCYYLFWFLVFDTNTHINNVICNYFDDSLRCTKKFFHHFFLFICLSHLIMNVSSTFSKSQMYKID